MKIVVCIKQVPARDAPLVIAEGGWIRETDIGFEMNEPDSFALEEALRLKEKHAGEVIAVSMGPERVKQTIKEALAKGADRGMHIADDKVHTLDPLGAAKLLAAAIEREKPDLVLTGLQSDDHGFGQTGVLLADRLGLPHATLKGIMSAKKKEIATIARGSLGVTHEPTQRIERIYVPTKTKKTEFLTGTPKEAAAKLLEKLRHEARVL